MKILIDTEKLPSLKDYTDREVFFIALLVVLFGYIVADYADSRRFNSVDSRIDKVEVTLDKVVDRLNTETIEADKAKEKTDKVYFYPKIKYSAIRNTGQKVYMTAKEFDCLARNVYWEALHEPLIGQIAVAQVTHNRLLSGKWGKNFCSVVFAKKQFSWTNDDMLRVARPKNIIQWNRAKYSVTLFKKGVRTNNLGSSQFYYADYIKKPKWAKDMIRDDKIGRHIFYTSLD